MGSSDELFERYRPGLYIEVCRISIVFGSTCKWTIGNQGGPKPSCSAAY